MYGSAFLRRFESLVQRTIKKERLITKTDKIAVAVSGGKDSQTVAYLLNRFFPGKVTCIAIDEGIPGYRSKTLADLKKFTKLYNLPLRVYSFEKEFGRKLKTFGTSYCKNCGVLRRYLLNKYAKGYTKLATGHNLDDECQSYMMNMLKGNLLLCAKLGPISGITHRLGFVQRVKPLYYCTEKDVAAYAFMKRFPVRFTECPYARYAFRAKVRDALNEIERTNKGFKLKIVKNFTKKLPALRKHYINDEGPVKCSACSQPSNNELCKACRILNEN